MMPFDPTEPEPMQIGVSVLPDEQYMWRVEMYLMSKYAPEFVEATIFKIRSAALERSKIAKEDHIIHQSVSSLQDAIEADLFRNVQWMPQRSHRKSAQTAKPNIGKAYQRELDRL